MAQEVIKMGSLLRYKIASVTGTIVLGIGSFMTCLSLDHTVILMGDLFLVLGILFMGYGYSKWQP